MKSCIHVLNEFNIEKNLVRTIFPPSHVFGIHGILHVTLPLERRWVIEKDPFRKSKKTARTKIFARINPSRMCIQNMENVFMLFLKSLIFLIYFKKWTGKFMIIHIWKWITTQGTTENFLGRYSNISFLSSNFDHFCGIHVNA